MGVSLLTLALAIGVLPLGTMSATAVSTDIVIAEFRTRGPSGGNDEFIELRNISTSPVSIAGWKIKGSNATGFTSTRATVPAGVQLNPGCSYLVVNTGTAGYSGSVPRDLNYSTGITDDGGVAVTTPTDLIVDQAGMSSGSAFKEGTTLAPLTTNVNRSYERKPGPTSGSVQDTDNNASDFALVSPSTPRNLAACSETAPTVTTTSPSAGATGVDRTANIRLTFSEPVNAAPGWYSIECARTGAHTATASGGPTEYTLDPDTDPAAAETCTVRVVAANITDQDPNDPPNEMAADFVFSFTTADGCGGPATYISQVQGSGARSSMIGKQVTVEGVVVGDYQAGGQFGGFHIQEEDADADEDAATSEGIFALNTSTAVKVGDLVRVTGTVAEGGSFATSGTQLNGATAMVCSEDNTVTITDVNFPVDSVGDLERYESMLVSIDQELTVTEVFNLGRFGEVVLSANGRQMTPTAVVEPGAEARALQALNDRNRIVLDDAFNTANMDPTAYPQGGLSASNTLRVGATVPSLSGVLDQRFALYRIQPVRPITFEHQNARPAAPESVGGRLRVSAMNVLNYFTTLDDGPAGCGPNGDMECRGAETPAEFQRQKAKIISALVGLDADIVGLMEIQNELSTDTTGGALADLVAGLNAAVGRDTYEYIDTGTIGTDAIKVALIYKSKTVTPVRDYAILDSSVDPRFDDTRSRPALAQTFKTRGGKLTVVVNHLKSKGSACAGDPDTGDGSGNCNVTRTRAAEALVDWLASDPTNSNDTDFLVIGDLNSYANEDPIDVFAAAGYTDLARHLDDDPYSYVFQGQSGYLDYALASPSLLSQVTGVTEWHINADEPTVLDYNTNFKSANHISTLYAPNAYRSSDHDPVLVGLRLSPDADPGEVVDVD